MTTQLRIAADSQNMRTEPSQKVEFANTLRGLACLSVVFAHYAGVFWEAPVAVVSLTGLPTYQITADQMPALNWFDNAIPNLQWGPLGVAIFFLISGFVIPYSLNRQSFVQFLLNRVFRIWPTYVCGFAVTAVAISVGCWMFASTVPFNSRDLLIHALPGLRDVVGGRNIDGIIWTLEIEVKFYALCALSAVWFRKSSPAVFALPVLIGVLALAVAPYIPGMSPTLAQWTTMYVNLSQYLVYMYIGVAFHFLHAGSLHPKQIVAWMATLGLLVCLIWSNSPYKASFPIAWNYAIAVCLFGWAMSYPNLLRSNRLLDAIAAISYPLYVVHGVAGYVLMRSFLSMGMAPWLNILLTACAATAVAYLLHVIVEVPTQKLGKRLGRRFEHQSPSTPEVRQAA